MSDRLIMKGSKKMVLEQMEQLSLFEDVEQVFQSLELWAEVFPEDETFIRKRSDHSENGYMLPGFDYYINMKKSFLIFLAWLLDTNLTAGGIELLLTLLGVTDGTILKICEYNGEKCIAKELLHQKKKRATKRILQGMKGECCNNQYECRYRQDGKCLCGEEETKEILERFAERGIVKKFGSYYQYQI